MAKKSKKLKFGDFDYSSIDEVACDPKSGSIVKVWCRVEKLMKPMQVDDGGQFKVQSQATLGDGNGESIETTWFSDKWYRKLKRYQSDGLPIEVLGTVEKVEKKSDLFVNALNIERVRSGARPTRLMQASQEELKQVKTFLKKLRNKAATGRIKFSLLEAHKETIIEKHQIVGLSNDEAYEDALESAILQGYSGDTGENYNPRIHNCIIGASATGKKLIWAAAKDVNILSEESQPIRTTEPGLTGVMFRKGDQWLVKPMKIPRANKGVFGIQDFDKCKKKEEVLSILGDVMEDGRCNISGAASGTFEAETGIHIDLNRKSDLFLDPQLKKKAVDDTGLPTYIISRFDNIVELKKDARVQAKKAKDLLGNSSRRSNPSSSIGRFCAKNGLDPERFQKLLVAYVREHLGVIDRRPVSRHMKRRLDELFRANKKHVKKLDDIAMFQTRFSHSVIKFVTALTRIQLLSVANKDAVDKAYHLLSRKLDFLKNLKPDLIVPGYRQSRISRFTRWLCEIVGKGTFEPAKIVERYVSEGHPCGPVEERTILNWIKKVADKEQQKKWRIKKDLLKELRKKA